MRKRIFNKIKALGRAGRSLRSLLAHAARGILYAAYACFLAIAYGYTTYPTMYALFEDGYVLEAYVFNLFTIIFWLLLEKLTSRLMTLRKWLSKNLFTKIIRAILVPKIGLVSIKSGLYLFYIYVLLQAKVLQLDPPPDITDSFTRYIMAMEYGIVMLVAADMFIKQFVIDRGRIREMDIAESSQGSGDNSNGQE